MATLIVANATRSDMVEAVRDAIDAGAAEGYLRIYDGAQPASPDVAVSTQVLLAELRFTSPCAGEATNGVLPFDAITEDVSANASGTATWARILDSDENPIFDCDVTDTGGGGTIRLTTTSIVIGGPVEITSFTLTQPSGA